MQSWREAARKADLSFAEWLRRAARAMAVPDQTVSRVLDEREKTTGPSSRSSSACAMDTPRGIKCKVCQKVH